MNSDRNTDCNEQNGKRGVWGKIVGNINNTHHNSLFNMALSILSLKILSVDNAHRLASMDLQLRKEGYCLLRTTLSINSQGQRGHGD